MNPAEPIVAVRPKLRQDTTFIAVPDGVFVRTDDTSFLLKGATIYQWITKLSAHLDGTHTLSELCAGLPEAQQRTITSIVSMLMERGLAKNCHPEDPSVVPEQVIERFRTQIEFIDHYADEPLRRFAAFRNAAVLLIGSGEARDAFVAASGRNGLARIHVPAAEHDAVAALQSPCTVERFDPASTLSGMDLVVYCGDDGRPGPVADLARRCRQVGVSFLPVTLMGRRSVLGPLPSPDGGPCWYCAMLRLNPEVDSSALTLWRDIAADVAVGPALDGSGPAVLRMLGTAAAVEAFAFLSGYRTPSTRRALVFQDLRTLESWRSPLIAHPLCPVCDEYRAGDGTEAQRQPASRQSGLGQAPAGDDAELGPDETYEKCISLIDKSVGVFTGFTDAELEQVPLKVARLGLGWPAAGSPVTAFGVDSLQDARHTVLLTAATRYVDAVIESRRLSTASAASLQAEGRHHIAPESIVGFSGLVECPPQAPLAWIAGSTLADGQPCWVPAAAVYPYSTLNQSGLYERTGAGTAAATSYAGLLRTGLCSAVAGALLRDVVRGRTGVRRVDPAVLLPDSHLGFLVKNVLHSGFDAELFLVVDGAFHLAVAAADGVGAANDAAASWAAGTTAYEALGGALVGLLGRIQALRTDGELPDTGRPLMADVPIEVLRRAVESVHSEPVMAGAAGFDLAASLSALGERGYRAVVVETTTGDLRVHSPLRTARVCLALG